MYHHAVSATATTAMTTPMPRVRRRRRGGGSGARAATGGAPAGGDATVAAAAGTPGSSPGLSTLNVDSVAVIDWSDMGSPLVLRGSCRIVVFGTRTAILSE